MEDNERDGKERGESSGRGPTRRLNGRGPYSGRVCSQNSGKSIRNGVPGTYSYTASYPTVEVPGTFQGFVCPFPSP